MFTSIAELSLCFYQRFKAFLLKSQCLKVSFDILELTLQSIALSQEGIPLGLECKVNTRADFILSVVVGVEQEIGPLIGVVDLHPKT
ncbi:hypothetical protein D3C75_947620 [compost metagenome]